jgi:class 3 adenylate cyclase
MTPFNTFPINLTLPYYLNHLTFHFSANDWESPHKIKYSFKIEGVDEGWSAPSSESKADYRNLPFGTFTLQVKAIGNAKIWSKPFTYTFTICPPWWHTWWAYALYLVLIAGTVLGYMRRMRQKIKVKQAQLEREQYLNRELRELNLATSRFVPKDFVQILDKKGLKELKLGDQTEATMTVLFADIRRYTKLSEQMTPEENFKFINAYLGRMGPIIQKNGGFICQYFGDGIMALFNGKHDDAVKTAIEMQQTLHRYNRKRFANNREQIKVGIGLNTGKLMLGVIGDEQRYDTSVISDAVNTASRMEGLTKIFGCQVIVSEKTMMNLSLLDDPRGPDSLSGSYRFLGKVKVKGKDQVLKIYDFYDGQTNDIRRLKSETKVHFEKGLQFYYDQEFGKAADLFKVILEKYPGDNATQYYMEKSVKYIIDGVDEKWSGAEEMVSK